MFFKKSVSFCDAFEAWHSMVACCDLRSFWTLKCDCMKKLVYLSVCLWDLKFNGGLLRFHVILEIEIRLSLRNHVFFRHAYGIWNSIGFCCHLISFCKSNSDSLEEIMNFRYAYGIWISTMDWCDSRSFWKSKWYVFEEFCIFSVCLRDLKFKGGLLRSKLILKVES